VRKRKTETQDLAPADLRKRKTETQDLAPADSEAGTDREVMNGLDILAAVEQATKQHAARQQTVPPKPWFTGRQFQEVHGISGNAAHQKLGRMTANGVLICKEFPLWRARKVYPTRCYRAP
jgi:hypothetical protein